MTLIRSGGLPLVEWLRLANGIPDWAAVQKAEQSAAAQLSQVFDEVLMELPESALRTKVYNARKVFFQRKKLPSNQIQALFRAEKSFGKLVQSMEHLQNAAQQQREAAEKFEENLSANFEALQGLANNETLRRALLFTSHELLESLPKFAEKPLAEFGKKDREVALALLKYLTRAVFKTSPLAGLTTVQAQRLDIAAESQGGGEAWMETKTMVEPNVALLPALYELLLQDEGFYRSLHLQLNPCVTTSSLKKDSGKLSWIYFDGEREAFQELDKDPVVECIAQILLDENLEMPFPLLLKNLQEAVEASENQLRELVFHLIDLGFLEWKLPELGLSPGWCGRLYNYLGFLSGSVLVREAAALLQWLKTTARTLPFHAIESAKELQREAVQQAKSFLEKHGGTMPPIPPEQIFFEDRAVDLPPNLPPGALEELVLQLSECWGRREADRAHPFRERLSAFAEQHLTEETDFLEFSRRFLESSRTDTQRVSRKEKVEKIGALLQVFREDGRYKAVVNAMYPGGGKLFARWLPLFSPWVSEQIQEWQKPSAADSAIEAAFPWQGWSNANFQASFFRDSVAVPDGRVATLAGMRNIALGDLAVGKNHAGMPQLVEKETHRPIVFNDLGLESPDTKPPIMQILWHLGVPFVSAESLIPLSADWQHEEDVLCRERVEFQSLVLARAAWIVEKEVCGKIFESGGSVAGQVGSAVGKLRNWGVPRQFFGRFLGRREKPQFYDMESPISMLLFLKNVRNGAGNLLIEEMLPLPEQCLGERTMEFVVECRTG